MTIFDKNLSDLIQELVDDCINGKISIDFSGPTPTHDEIADKISKAFKEICARCEDGCKQ